MKKITASQILNLIKKLPDVKNHITISPLSGHYCVTNEWFTGSFGGRAFEGNSYEDAANKLINYMYEHVGHKSLVGDIITKSGFPDLEKMYDFLLNENGL